MRKGPILDRKLAGAFGLLLALALVIGLAAPAFGTPGIPMRLAGELTLDGSPAPVDTVIEARIGGVNYAYGDTATDADGKYGYPPGTGYYVEADDNETPAKEGGAPGDTVEFYADGVKVGETAFQSGGPHFVNLTDEPGATPTPTPEPGTPTPTPEPGTPTPTPTATPSTYTLTMQALPGSGGSTTPSVGTYTYGAGDVVNISAVANNCYRFSSWTGNVASSSSATTTVTMDQNQTVTARFSYTCGGGGVPPPLPTASPSPSPEPTATVPPASPTPTAAPTVPPLPGEEEVDLPVDDDGVLQDDVVFSGFSGYVGVNISSGTIALTEGGDPLPQITVTEVCFGYPPPPANAYVVGCAYDFQPDGATFDPPITITLKYDDGLLPPGVAEEDLVIAVYNAATGEWQVLPTTVDTENNVLTAEVSHFTYFAVYAAAPEATPTAPPTAPPTVAPTPTPEPDEGGSNVGLIIGVIVGVLILIAIIYFVMRRRGEGGAAPTGGTGTGATGTGSTDAGGTGAEEGTPQT